MSARRVHNAQIMLALSCACLLPVPVCSNSRFPSDSLFPSTFPHATVYIFGFWPLTGVAR